MSNLIEQRDVVVATVEKLKAKLGEAITSGNEKARIKASADLAEAPARRCRTEYRHRGRTGF